MAVTLTNSQLSAGLYSAFWNRAPDATGQNFWVGQLNSGVSTLAVATQFYNAPEGLAAYPNWIRNDPAALVTQAYTSVFNRAPDAGGLAFYVAQINSGVAFPQVVINMMLNALNADNTDGDQFANEIQVGIYVSEVLRTDDPFITGQALEGVTADPASVTAREAQLAQMAAQTFTLTTGLDAPGFGAFALTSPHGNSNTYGIIDNVAGGNIGTDQTLNAFDQIQATGANNVMTLVDSKGASYLTAAQVSGIQTLNVRSAGAVGATAVGNFDVSGWTGLTAVNVTQSNGPDFLKAAATTAVNVVDTAGTVTVAGGSTQNVTTAGGVALSGAAGAVTAVDTAQGTVNSTIDNGTNVTLTTTATNVATSGTVKVGNSGGAATPVNTPSGTVTVTQNLVGATGTGAGSVQGGAITITGGTVDTVNIVSSQATAGATTTAGAVTVNGTAVTTTVNVTESQVAAVTAQAGSAQVATVTFGALAAGESVTFGGLTFKATAAMTSSAVQAAFASLANGATTGPAASSGTYTGTLTGWSTNSSSVFTNVAVGPNKTLFTPTDAAQVAGAPNAVSVTYTNGAAAVTGVNGLVAGAITVNDVNYNGGAPTAAGTITSVTANGFVGLTINDNALSTLNLTGSGVAQGTVAINNGGLVNNTATTLNATLNTNTLTALQDAGVYKTLNVALNGASTVGTLSASAATALNLSGTGSVAVSTASLAALRTVSVAGAAGLTGASGAALDLSGITTLTDVNASATSGNNAVKIDATKATYEGGSGNDAVTVSAAVSKAITLGAGNDTVTLASGTTTLGATITGGLGTDTLSMVTADAVTASASSLFTTKLVGFDALTLSTAGASTQTVHIDTMGMNAVNVAGGTSGTLTLDGWQANGGVLTLTGANAGTISLTSGDFNTPTNNDVTVVLSAAGALSGGTVNVTGVESVAIQANDTTAGVAAGTNAQSVTLTDATSTTKVLSSITVTGNSDFTLTATGSTALTTVNASAMTGNLHYTTVGTVVETVTGGSGNDVLTAGTTNAKADVLIGGAGNDTLVANALSVSMTGGSGTDNFVIQYAAANTNTYTTIADLMKGDMLTMVNHSGGATTFASTAVSLQPTAQFTDYLNAAAGAANNSGTAAAAMSWFQFGGNTYVVEALGNHVTSNGTFIAGTDIVVQLTGTVDLSHAQLVGGGSATQLLII